MMPSSFPQGMILELKKPKEDTRNDAPKLPTRPNAETQTRRHKAKQNHMMTVETHREHCHFDGPQASNTAISGTIQATRLVRKAAVRPSSSQEGTQANDSPKESARTIARDEPTRKRTNKASCKAW